MDFIKTNIYTNSGAVDVLIAQLSGLGIEGFEIHDSADFGEFLENKDMNWDYVDDDLMGLKTVPTHITLYLHDNAQGLETLSQLKDALSEYSSSAPEFYGDLRTEFENVREEDWANNWKKYYKPFNVGKRLMIKPSWENAEPEDGRKVLEIDPASSFGTGQHATTKMVLELLEDTVNGNEKMLDLGCGSGILTAAGLLLGVKNAVMVDIFENAVKTASENVIKNGFDDAYFKALKGNITEDAELRGEIGTDFGIVTANIVADVIIGMSPFFGEFLGSDGTLIVSGIIDERLNEVLDALKENGFELITMKSSEGWNAAALKKSEKELHP